MEDDDGHSWCAVEPAAKPRQRLVTCRHCGAVGSKVKERGLSGIEVLIAIPLFLMCLLPGIIYFIAMESTARCRMCGKRSR